MIFRLASNPIVWGSILTILVFTFGWWGALQPACFETNSGFTTCPSKWFYLKQSTPNELGDTLAGFAGSLAFVWIVVTVLLQRKELEAQREELTLTRSEFKTMASAQQEQVGLMKEQSKIYKNQQKQNLEDGYRSILEQMLIDVVHQIWEISEKRRQALDEQAIKLLSIVDDVGSVQAQVDFADRYIRGNAYRCELFLQNYEKKCKSKNQFTEPRRKAWLEISIAQH